MMDWEDVGRRLCDEWKSKREYPELASPEEEEEFRVREKARQLLTRAVNRALDGDGLILAACIDTGGAFSREQIAATLYLESWRRVKRRRRGAPRDEKLDLDTEAVESFFLEWAERNKAEGISDWGKRGLMRELSCDYISEFLDGDAIDKEAVLDRLRRPRNRRR